jgi:hypothetical protein
MSPAPRPQRGDPLRCAPPTAPLRGPPSNRAQPTARFHSVSAVSYSIDEHRARFPAKRRCADGFAVRLAARSVLHAPTPEGRTGTRHCRDTAGRRNKPARRCNCAQCTRHPSGARWRVEGGAGAAGAGATQIGRRHQGLPSGAVAKCGPAIPKGRFVLRTAAVAARRAQNEPTGFLGAPCGHRVMMAANVMLHVPASRPAQHR